MFLMTDGKTALLPSFYNLVQLNLDYKKCMEHIKKSMLAYDFIRKE